MSLPAQDADLAAIGQEDVHDHPQRGRLARSVRPDEAVDGALGHVERQVVDGDVRAEGLGDAANLDGAHERSDARPGGRVRIARPRVAPRVPSLTRSDRRPGGRRRRRRGFRLRPEQLDAIVDDDLRDAGHAVAADESGYSMTETAVAVTCGLSTARRWASADRLRTVDAGRRREDA